ncbi:MAG: Glycerol-3-phosphate ABC transporter, permease protein UgpA, partial [uncultured Nocardioides sp.]
DHHSDRDLATGQPVRCAPSAPRFAGPVERDQGPDPDRSGVPGTVHGRLLPLRRLAGGRGHADERVRLGPPRVHPRVRRPRQLPTDALGHRHGLGPESLCGAADPGARRSSGTRSTSTPPDRIVDRVRGLRPHRRRGRRRARRPPRPGRRLERSQVLDVRAPHARVHGYLDPVARRTGPRDGARAAGQAARHVVLPRRLLPAVRPAGLGRDADLELPPQPRPRPPGGPHGLLRDGPDRLAQRPRPGDVGDHRHDGVVVGGAEPGALPRRSPRHRSQSLRGRRPGRGGKLGTVRARHRPRSVPRVGARGHHAADRVVPGLRAGLHHDAGRAGRRDARGDPAHLRSGLPRPPARLRRRRVAVPLRGDGDRLPGPVPLHVEGVV